MNKLLGALLIVISIVLVGCVESRDEYTLNPDGSGKVLRSITVPSMSAMMGNMGGGAGGTPDLESEAKEKVRQMLEESQGVDVWKDVAYSVTAGDKIHIEGTAYFADISKVALAGSDFEDQSALVFSRDASGTVTVTMEQGNQEGIETQLGGLENMDVDSPAFNQELEKQKAQFAAQKPMMQAMLGGLKVEVVIHMPGPLQGSSNLQRVDDHTVSLTLMGQKLIEMQESLLNDPERLKTIIRMAKDPAADPTQVELLGNELLFGERAPVQAVSASGAPTFDYAAETADAQANYQAMVDSLRLDTVSAEPSFESLDNFTFSPSDTDISVDLQPMTGSETTTNLPSGVDSVLGTPDTTATAPVATTGNVRVAGVRMVRVSDSSLGILPLGQRAGYTVSLIAELPEAAVKVTGGIVTKATTNTVQNLLPEHIWDRRITGVLLAKDKKTILFETRLALPDEGATGLDGISGTLEYLTATGSQLVDLGNMDFEEGAKGSQFGAVIASIGKDPYNNNPTMINLRLDIKPEEIESVEFADPSIKMVGKQAIGDRTLVQCAAAGGSLPASGSVAVKVYEDLQVKTFTFDVGGVSLTGGPMR